jgi:hypothetical protein
MAAHPIVIIDHGKVEIPEELQSDPRFRDGARLQLVPVSSYVNSESERKQAWDAFLSLEGLLAHSDYDPNAELEKEKQRELEEEERWGPS